MTLLNLVLVGKPSKQNVGDDLNVCVLELLPEVSTLPSLVVISFSKVKIYFFQFVMWPNVDQLIEGSCDFNDGSLSRKVNRLPSLVPVGVL